MTEENQEGRNVADQEAVDQIRKNLAEGFAAIRGSEVSTGLSAISVEEMLARSIIDIQQDQTDIRPSKINAVKRIQEQVTASIERALTLPPQTFVMSDSGAAANTNQDGSGPTPDDDADDEASALELGEDEGVTGA